MQSLIVIIFQAYAELEKDTPGQIFGVTFKSDGKSSMPEEEPISEKFTQRPKNEDTYYEEHDIKDTHDFKKNQLSWRVYFGFGVFLVFVLVNAMLSSNDGQSRMLEYERDLALERQRQKREGIERSAFGDDA